MNLNTSGMLYTLLFLLNLHFSCGANLEHLRQRIFRLERRVVEDNEMLRREFHDELKLIKSNENASEVIQLIENESTNTTALEDVVEQLVASLNSTIGQLKKGFNEEKRVVRSVEREVDGIIDHLGDLNGGLKDVLSSLVQNIKDLNLAFKSQKSDPNTEVLTVLKNIDKRLNAKTYADCYEYLSNGHKTSGIYTIQPATFWRPLEVYCDMTTSGGGWTVFQRRQDGSENFERLWLDYAFGFGDLNGEFWLGNEFIHRLTSRGPHELRIELEDFDKDSRVAEYGLFSVGPASDLFKLGVEFFTGNVSDSLIPSHNGYQFSTKDKGPSAGCASSYKGGFWYSNCHSVNINGLYLKGEHKSYANGVNWKEFRGYHYSLKRTEMKFRPR